MPRPVLGDWKGRTKLDPWSLLPKDFWHPEQLEAVQGVPRSLESHIQLVSFGDPKGRVRAGSRSEIRSYGI